MRGGGRRRALRRAPPPEGRRGLLLSGHRLHSGGRGGGARAGAALLRLRPRGGAAGQRPARQYRRVRSVAAPEKPWQRRTDAAAFVGDQQRSDPGRPPERPGDGSAVQRGRPRRCRRRAHLPDPRAGRQSVSGRHGGFAEAGRRAAPGPDRVRQEHVPASGAGARGGRAGGRPGRAAALDVRHGARPGPVRRLPVAARRRRGGRHRQHPQDLLRPAARRGAGLPGGSPAVAARAPSRLSRHHQQPSPGDADRLSGGALRDECLQGRLPAAGDHQRPRLRAGARRRRHRRGRGRVGGLHAHPPGDHPRRAGAGGRRGGRAPGAQQHHHQLPGAAG